MFLGNNGSVRSIQLNKFSQSHRLYDFGVDILIRRIKFRKLSNVRCSMG